MSEDQPNTGGTEDGGKPGPTLEELLRSGELPAAVVEALEEARQRVAQADDRARRALAEADNQRKRLARESESNIRFANEYIHQQLAQSPRLGLQVAAGLDQGARAFEQVFAGGGTEVEKYGVAVEARLEAGFSQAEVDVAVRMSDERRAAVRRRLGVTRAEA